MRNFFNVVRVILTIPLFILLAIVLILSPLLISLKFTVFNADYIKNIVGNEKTLQIVEDNVFKNTEEEGAKLIEDMIFGDTTFLKNTLYQGIDNVFIWLERDTDQISVTADRNEAENKYLGIAYDRMEQEIQKELGKNVDLSKVPLCKKNLSNEELKIRFIDGVPCLPVDLKTAVNESFKELGLNPNEDTITLFSVPKENLTQLDLLRTVYWIIENSIALTIGTILSLLVLIVIISPKTTTGYILSGIFTLIISTANLAIFSYIPYFKVDDLLKRVNVERNEISEEIIREAYENVFSKIILDIGEIGRNVSLYILTSSVLIIATYIAYRVVSKKKETKETSQSTTEERTKPKSK
ncbi:MAG TPA: hypothetical protein PLV59_00540 [Candidatus Dojkabacteria bacterium]|nr:hypothetical protein [Candidatus Dojkabacteria bacterium]